MPTKLLNYAAASSGVSEFSIQNPEGRRIFRPS